MNHRQTLRSLYAAHDILCVACQEMINSRPWYTNIPFVGSRWWRGYEKLHDARRHIFNQGEREFPLALWEMR